jgi:hypothetical protein
MRYPVPTIAESADDLKPQLAQERHPAKRLRLHALYLLASEQADSRQEIARLLGVSTAIPSVAGSPRTHRVACLPCSRSTCRLASASR